MKYKMMIVDYDSKYKEKLYLFFASAMEEMGYEFIPESKDSDIAQVEQTYLVDNGCFLLATSGDKVVGSIGVRKLGGGFAELKRFYVLESYQGNGIGKKLMEKSIKNARSICFHSLRLDTTSKSTQAIRLFEKQGFQEIPKYNDDPYAELYMELKL